jgi:iron complex transport system substrate-binding protein
MQFPPRRLVCLTEETVETLYWMQEQDRIVGVTGYAVRPPQVRKEKPRVSAFTSANLGKILALKPDLVLAFSDLQADIAAELGRAGVAVHLFNQRDVAGIFAMIEMVGALIGEPAKGVALANELRRRVDAVAASAPQGRRPRVYFEEWDEPLITGIGWVSELIEIAGGVDCFARLRGKQAAKDRIIMPEDVIAAKPDVIVASWCGKKVSKNKIAGRMGWDAVPAVANKRIVEIKSPLILQPGPAALTDGLDALVAAIR